MLKRCWIGEMKRLKNWLGRGCQNMLSGSFLPFFSLYVKDVEVKLETHLYVCQKFSTFGVSAPSNQREKWIHNCIKKVQRVWKRRKPIKDTTQTRCCGAKRQKPPDGGKDNQTVAQKHASHVLHPHAGLFSPPPTAAISFSPLWFFKKDTKFLAVQKPRPPMISCVGDKHASSLSVESKEGASMFGCVMFSGVLVLLGQNKTGDWPPVLGVCLSSKVRTDQQKWILTLWSWGVQSFTLSVWSRLNSKVWWANEQPSEPKNYKNNNPGLSFSVKTFMKDTFSRTKDWKLWRIL